MSRFGGAVVDSRVRDVDGERIALVEGVLVEIVGGQPSEVIGVGPGHEASATDARVAGDNQRLPFIFRGRFHIRLDGDHLGTTGDFRQGGHREAHDDVTQAKHDLILINGLQLELVDQGPGRFIGRSIVDHLDGELLLGDLALHSEQLDFVVRQELSVPLDVGRRFGKKLVGRKGVVVPIHQIRVVGDIGDDRGARSLELRDPLVLHRTNKAHQPELLALEGSNRRPRFLRLEAGSIDVQLVQPDDVIVCEHFRAGSAVDGQRLGDLHELKSLIVLDQPSAAGDEFRGVLRVGHSQNHFATTADALDRRDGHRGCHESNCGSEGQKGQH